ncbi:MAG: hypothetical protein Q8R29_00285, partial [bacterium]|nr:hypothetical protein [bacterium]
PVSVKPASVKIEEPKKVVREAVPAKALPKKPELKVALYPDQSAWYSQLGEVIALWDLPEDILAVATKIDKNSNTKPQELEKELFTGKSFGVLKEGIWYIHIRFKNNVGLGETAHYKISLDTTAPLPFEAEMDNLISDNPTPEVRHKTQDSLSGVAETLIFIDGKGPTESAEVFTKMPPQSPGKHTVLVRVLDRAGNGVQDDLEFEILPLPTPVIDFVSKTVYQGEVIFASGKAIPNANILVRIVDKNDREVFAGKTPSDSSGNWGVSASEATLRGTYLLSATALDSRGATSYPTQQFTFEVKVKPVISFGGIELGWLGIFLASLLFIAAGISIAAWYHVSRKKTHEAYKIIVGRDVEKLSTILSDNLKELEGTQEIHDPSRQARSTALMGKMKEAIAKMKKYLGEEVKKLK